MFITSKTDVEKLYGEIRQGHNVSILEISLQKFLIVTSTRRIKIEIKSPTIEKPPVPRTTFTLLSNLREGRTSYERSIHTCLEGGRE